MDPRILLSVAVLSLAAIPAANSGAAAIWGATEWTQIANNTQLVLQYAESTKQSANQGVMLSNQGRQISLQLEQLRIETDNFSKLSLDQWSRGKALVAALAEIIRRHNGLVFDRATMDEQMAKRFPGYAKQMEDHGVAKEFFQASLDIQNKTVNAQIDASLEKTQFLRVQFEDRNATLDTLRDLNNNAAGQCQLLQVSNRLALEMNRNLVNMQELMAMQNEVVMLEARNAEAQRAKEETAKAAAAEQAKAFFQPGPSKALGPDYPKAPTDKPPVLGDEAPASFRK